MSLLIKSLFSYFRHHPCLYDVFWLSRLPYIVIIKSNQIEIAFKSTDSSILRSRQIGILDFLFYTCWHNNPIVRASFPDYLSKAGQFAVLRYPKSCSLQVPDFTKSPGLGGSPFPLKSAKDFLGDLKDAQKYDFNSTL